MVRLRWLATMSSAPSVPAWRAGARGALVRVVAPVTSRRDAIGLLELFLPAAPDAAVIRKIGETAHALAYIVIANRSFTDLYQWGWRTLSLSLVAEIQHRLLPSSLMCEAAQFAVAGALEPPDRAGGDTFDYVLDRDTVQLSITDAMGHDVRAALLATLVVGALRRARRATPRVGGDHEYEPTLAPAADESPPRRWGQLALAGLEGHLDRTTPASAGTTRRSISASAARANHPRVGGDHGECGPQAADDLEPPPHRRGPHPRRLEQGRGRRTTPASAGITRACRSPSP